MIGCDRGPLSRVLLRVGLLLLSAVPATMFSPAAARSEDAALPVDLSRAVRSSPVTYDVDLAVVVTPPYHAHKLSVWIPVPPSDAGQELLDSQWSVFPTRVTPQLAAEPLFGNRFAYFEFADPAGAQIIHHRFRITVWEQRWGLEPDKVELPSAWPEVFDCYRRSESQGVVVDSRFRDVLDQIVPRRSHVAHDFQRVFGWVEGNFTYDHIDASLQASAEHGLSKRRGHCSDYHSFCASLGRALGVPTRVAYGINPFPKNSPSHCKLEAYLPPYGWVSFDVSETQKLVAAIDRNQDHSAMERAQLAESARRRLREGFRDNTWFAQTRGTDYDLAPPASRRVPVVRTAYVEADGEPLPDPDPANKEQRAFSWMTAHEYRADRTVTYPFSDLMTLAR